MPAKKWSTIKEKFSVERQARIENKVREELKIAEVLELASIAIKSTDMSEKDLALRAISKIFLGEDYDEWLTEVVIKND